MVTRLSLILLLTTVLSVFAGHLPRRMGENRVSASPRSTLKQVTRAELVNKTRMKAVLKRSGIQKRQQSAKVYPKCAVPAGTQSYARYAHYDLPGGQNDFASYSGLTLAQCFGACSSMAGGACAGVFWFPDAPQFNAANNANYKQCYLKTAESAAVTTNYKADPGTGPNDGHELALAGGCALWAGTVPSAMDAICCDNV